jgi:hypothetical protein
MPAAWRRNADAQAPAEYRLIRKKGTQEKIFVSEFQRLSVPAAVFLSASGRTRPVASFPIFLIHSAFQLFGISALSFLAEP